MDDLYDDPTSITDRHPGSRLDPGHDDWATTDLDEALVWIEVYIKLRADIFDPKLIVQFAVCRRGLWR